MNSDKNTLGYLGADYQLRLVAQVLNDKKFANIVLNLLKPNYFDNEHLKIIMSEIINAFEQDEVIVDYGSLTFRLMARISNEIQQNFIKETLDTIKASTLNDVIKIQSTAIKFCKQQETKKAVFEIQKIIERGDLEEYDKCEALLKSALEVGVPADDGEDNFDNINDVLADDFRDPIPTGITKLDEVMNGGLSRGELGIVLAALGVGKTTCATKIANTAFNLGLNVIQIFFEDTPKIIKRKHIACWSGIELNELQNHKDELITLVNDKLERGGSLMLKKFSSVDTTMGKIRNFVKKQISSGVHPDLIIIDYIDCVQPSRHNDDVNAGEAMIMREFENLLFEYNIAGYAMIQGNRSAIKSEVVDTDQMGGSIKKAQIGHFILSIARTIDQKETNQATLAVLKSRFGKDGVIFKDVLFDNARVNIEIGDNDGSKTFLQTKNDKDSSGQERVRAIMADMKKERDKNKENGNA